jgi:hypothetical protein
MFKKLFLTLTALLIVSSVAMAENMPAFLKVGSLEVNVPLENLSLIPGLYDFWNAAGRIGMETQVIGFNDFSINVGVITSFQGKLPPLISIDYNFAKIIPNLKPETNLKLGIWYAHNFDIDQQPEHMAGIKSSVILF